MCCKVDPFALLTHKIYLQIISRFQVFFKSPSSSFLDQSQKGCHGDERDDEDLDGKEHIVAR
jgi:hypothetical protein